MFHFIKTTIEDVNHIIHDGQKFKVIDGFAFVPQNVRDELTKFAHWNDNTDTVPQAVQDKLIPAEAKKQMEQDAADAKAAAQKQAQADAEANAKALAESAERAKAAAEQAKAAAETAAKEAEEAAKAAADAQKAVK